MKPPLIDAVAGRSSLTSFTTFCPPGIVKAAVETVAGPPINVPAGVIAKTSTLLSLVEGFRSARPVYQLEPPATCPKNTLLEGTSCTGTTARPPADVSA